MTLNLVCHQILCVYSVPMKNKCHQFRDFVDHNIALISSWLQTILRTIHREMNEIALKS